MRKMILNLIFLLLPVLGFSQDVIGKWTAHDGSSIVEVTVQDGVCSGKIVWMKEAEDKNGKPLLDARNKDKSLRSRPLVGLTVFDSLKQEGNEWKGGNVYDPESGKTYKCKLKVVNGKLHVTGSLGPFSKTLKWTRSAK